MVRPFLTPLLMAPANFTPRARTPWGGPRLAALKAGVVSGAVDEHIGESWEISGGPEFPSRLEDGRPLAEALAEAPDLLLGGREMELLVKLLDAAAPLSVQIHPRNDDPALAPDESGKPEAWFVVDHLEGAGVYLGLGEGVDERALRRAVSRGEDMSRLLRFHPVARGDFFLVEPGVPHAVGPGVFLVEPQRVHHGKRGVTYRYWDWNRRYDAEGRVAPEGEGRPLHLARALEVTDFARPGGEAFERSVRRSLGPAPLSGVSLDPLAGVAGGIRSDDLAVFRLAGTGRATLPLDGRLVALTVVRGAVTWSGDPSIVIQAGRTAAIPAALERREVIIDRAEAILSAIP